MPSKYPLVAVGGTFDFLHEGHIHLLSKSFEIGEKVIIGVTSDNLARGKNHYVPPLNVRIEKLKSFLKDKGWLHRAEIVILEDPYGPTITEREISAIVVSEETLARALEINRIRRSKLLPPLKVIVIPLVKDFDYRPISSTKIRRNERHYIKFFNSNCSIIVS